MADNNTLYLGIELRGKFEEQIKKAAKDAEALAEVFDRMANSGVKDVTDSVLKNLKKNTDVATDALYKLLEAKEKAEKAIERNNISRKENLFGIDESSLAAGIKRIDEIVKNIMNIGVAAYESKTAVKDLMSSMSADITIKDVKNRTSEMNKELDKNDRAIEKQRREAEREAKKALKDEEEAAARNASNQERVKDALAKVATARSRLSEVSQQASEQERMHVELLLRLLDRLSQKLSMLKGTDLSEKGILAGVLGSGYQGLMRNVNTSIVDLKSGKLNNLGMGDDEWEREKALAAQLERRKQIIAAVDEQGKTQAKAAEAEAAAQDKVEAILRMRAHRKDMDTAKEDAEMAAVARQLNRELAEQKEKQAKAAEAVRQHATANRGLADAYNRVVSAGKSTSALLSQIQNQMGSYLSLYGAEHLLKSVIQVGGEFEVQHIALQSILGDVQQANSLFEQMKELAVVSPFNFRQLASYSKQISAFGVPFEEMYDTTKRLADISAGLGVDMGRLILAYGQVRSAAVLRGQELRQFTEAGIPMVQALAQEFTRLNGRMVSTAEVFELISKRAVPFEMVKKVLWDMTNEGGRFFDMQFVLADTLAGKWSNLQDAWEIMLSDVAKGESMTGKLLKYLVEGATTLVENLHTMAPLIAGIAGAIASVNVGKWVASLGNLGNFGLNGVEKNIKSAQRLHALELKRLYLNMQIGEEQYKQGLNLNKNKQNYYLMLAQEGKLKEIQIARAVQQRKINVERIEERLAAGQINELEAAQLRLWRMKYMHANLFKLSIKSIGATINTMLGPIGWISLALDAILTTVFAIKGHSDEIAQKNQELVDSFVNKSRELRESIQSISEQTPANEADYKSGIEGMKEMLKQHSANYDAIVREANGIKTLEGQYDFLKGKLKDSEKVYQQVQETVSEFGDHTRDDFERAKKYARDYFRSLKDDSTTMSGRKSILENRKFTNAIGSIAEYIKQEIPNVGMDDTANELYRQLRNSLIQEMGYGAREGMMVKIRLNEMLHVEDGEGAADLIMPEFTTMIDKINAHLANKIRHGQELTEAERAQVQKLVNDAIKNTGEKYPEYASYLQNLLNSSNFTATIQLRFATEMKISDYQKQIYENFPEETDDKIKNIAVRWGESGSSYQAANAAKKDIDEIYNELISREREYKKGKTTAERVDEARTQYNNAVSAALYGLGYDYEGEKKRSNKVKSTGGSKKDALLDQWKSQFAELKAFYQEYKKWAKIVGKDTALKKLQEEGLFAGMFKDGKPIYDISDWGKALDDFRKGTQGGTPARDRFQTELKKEKLTLEFDVTKEEMEKMMKRMQAYLSEASEKYNLYKTLFEKTGDKDFAMVAFSGGRLFDDITNNMAEQLRESMEKQKQTDIAILLDWDGDEQDMQEYFEKNFKNGDALFKMWQEIVKLTGKAYTDGLNDIAAATEKMLTTEGKIRIEEEKIAKLRKDGAKDNDPRILAEEKKISELRMQEFEESEAYLRFYAGILSMTAGEAENIGALIKQNLVDRLADGTINADKFLKSIKNVEQQLATSRGRKSDFMALATGGIKGYFENRKSRANDSFSAEAIRIETLEKNILEERKKLHKAESAADEKGVLAAKIRIGVYEQDIEQAKERMKRQKEMLGIADKTEKSLNNALDVLELIDGAIDGLQQSAQQLSDMFAALGHEGSANTWSDIADITGIIGAPVKSVTNALKSALSGDVGGILSNAVGIFTSPITMAAQFHDKKRQREIEKSEKKVKDLTTAFGNLQTAMEKTLGGIYTTGGYTEMYENLLKQRAEIQKQRDLEDDKKKTDKSKIADYDQQLKELDDTISRYQLDMAKTLYDIDLQSWASQLTEAIVGAWEKGEDAVEAYRSKVKDIMKDLTTNILAKKVMEKAIGDLGIDKIISDVMDAESGKLNESAIPRLADALNKAGGLTAETIMRVLDELEKGGYVERGDESSGSSASSTIKGITENTADLLASYINAIRADVSVNRMTLTEMLMLMQGQAEMPVIAQAQLQQLQMIAENTLRNALAAEQIYEMLHANTMGANYFRVK